MERSFPRTALFREMVPLGGFPFGLPRQVALFSAKHHMFQCWGVGEMSPRRFQPDTQCISVATGFFREIPCLWD